MKTLSIRQPWASIICAGIKDVENRTWKTNYRGKLLIHSSSYKCPKGVANLLPLEMGNTLLNEDLYGNIDLNDFPSSSIIGYVDLSDCVEGEYDSIWAEKDSVKFVMKNAYMFDEPITGVKGKLNIFDYDIDENNLPPAHKAELRSPRIEGNTFVLPLSVSMFNGIQEIEGLKYFPLYETDVTIKMLCDYNKADDSNSLKNFDNIKSIRLVAKDGRELTYKFSGIEWHPEKDEKDKVISIPNLNNEEKEVWLFSVFFE